MNNSNIKLSSAAAISTDAETFYRDYWVTGHTTALASSILRIHKEAELLDKYFLEPAVVQNLESIAGTP